MFGGLDSGHPFRLGVDFLADSDPVANPRGAGRIPNRERHATAIQEAERKFADKLPEVAELMLELALGTKPEKCPAHHVELACPKTVWVQRPSATSEGVERPCDYKSRGVAANQNAMVYVLNRIAGTPAPSGDKQLSMEFVRKIAKHVADVFSSVNYMDDPEERARNFASGIAQMWLLIGES